MNTLAVEKLAQARAIIRKKTPYYRAAALSLIPVEKPGYGTLGCTDTYVLYYDPDYVIKIDVQELAGVMVHEVWHLLQKHHARFAGRDPMIANIATDLAINPPILAAGFKLPADCLMPAMYGWPDGQTADEYYRLLLAKKRQDEQKDPGDKDPDQKEPGQDGGNQDQKDPGDKDPDQKEPGHDNQDQKDPGDGQEGQSDGQSGDGQEGQSDGQEGQSGDGQSGDGQKQPAKPAQPAQGHCGSCAGLPAQGEPADEGRSTAAIERIARQTAMAVQKHVAQHGIGSVPGAIQEWANVSLGITKIKWQQILAKKIRQASTFASGANVASYAWHNRRQASVGYGAGKPLMAGTRSPQPRVTVAIDTSGSMGSSDLESAIAETHGILKTLHAQVEIIGTDIGIRSCGHVSNWKQIAKHLIGRGGTDFRPVFEEIQKRPARKRPQILIYITDGGGIAPADAPYGIRVIWVLVGAYQRIPYSPNYDAIAWGEIVEVK